uniref:Ubiquitin-like domain-containing protein n=1 Tax=Alexandrium catenella TaxID=2925 RepID=A0A7S1RKA3_ALECA|mmetsp:Transcript_61438/g.164375  ORF Transcript_61438/g.164375 Transcript_61438/m.164375 type:complete len:209 (+) Transcript_61438:42-668(+)
MATVLILVDAAFSGERLATVELQTDSTVDQLRTAVSAASPATSTFSALIFDGAALSDGAADMASVGLRDGSVLQLVAGQQLIATLEGCATLEERDRAGVDELNYAVSVEPCDVDEFGRKAEGKEIQQFTVADVLAIVEEKYMAAGRLCGTDDLATEEAVLSFIKGACGASGFLHRWTASSHRADRWGHSHTFLMTGHLLTLTMDAMAT